MRVHVNADVCQGHTLCAIAAPGVFHLSEEDGHAYVDDAPVPVDREEAVRNAMLTCPERAITIDDD